MVSSELSDPRLMLFVIYGLIVIILGFCSFTQMVNHHIGLCPWLNSQVEDEHSEEPQSDGLIYELLTQERKLEIDRLREGIFCRLLGSFSLKLESGSMLIRCKSETSDITESTESTVHHNIEEGVEKKNQPTADDTIHKSTEDNRSSENYTHMLIPCPGIKIDDNASDNKKNQTNTNDSREVPIFCAICLSEYELDEEVCWSSNPNCTHVFHKECMLEWLVALGRRKSKMKRFPNTPSEKRLLNYELECPCCRQDFIVKSSDKEEV